ncbi:MAG: XRE family transcriptional regulator [Paracoccaceae bacterium]
MMPNLDTASDIREIACMRARSRRVALNLTPAELSARSGVFFGTLKRFEHTDEVSFATLPARAGAMDALEGFHSLFPPIEARGLQDPERQSQPPKRARAKGRLLQRPLPDGALDIVLEDARDDPA